MTQEKEFFEKGKILVIEDCSPEVLIYLKSNNVKFKIVGADNDSFGFDPDMIKKYSKIANFIQWPLAELLEDILKAELRMLEDEPSRIFEIFLNDKEILELIYNSCD